MIMSIALISLNHISGDGKHLIERINFVLDIALETETADESISTRLDMYRSGVNAFLESPVIGYGYENRYNLAKSMDQNLTFRRNIKSFFGLIVYVIVSIGERSKIFSFLPLSLTLR